MTDHRITHLRVHCVTIPARAVHSHGSGDVGGINAALLELATDTGLTGWGEASPWPVFTGTVEGNAAALHTHLRPHVIGQNPTQIEPIMAQADRTLVGHPEAKAALECALLDLTGQITNLPIAELVGGRHRTQIPLSFSVANPDFDADLDDITQLWADGIRIFKLKTGFADHAFDLMRLEKLRSTYGDAARLRIDYNQGLPAYDAIRHIRDLETFRPDFVEQPVKMHEREALAAITSAVDVPIMADESVFNVRDALQGAHNRIANIFSLKTAKSGGVRRCVEIAAIARAAGVEVYGGCMFETSIAHMAGAHLMAAIPDLTLGCEFYMSTYYAETDIAQTPFPVRGGHVHVPTTPGLGTAPDPDTLARYRTDLLEET
ncbi:enolase C-terminal domain-like protein [uncultured Tateyamaria sp.]|uniref:enolase C-terminal domain-like protein n=1 Tax=uncultured Tateyamaria sp. TaxID=455651 RepID=UPI00260639C0|nr:enolase C-terminal domain-like protein [uncultured Tateyamaria sp.]